MSKLSLTARKNIKEAEPKLAANLKRITAASGITFEVEVDWLVIAPVADERGYKDRYGEIVYDWYLDGLAYNIEQFCKDPIQKESFVEAFGTAKRISMSVEDQNEEEGGFYAKTKNDSGSLVIRVLKDRFCSNVSETGNDLSNACSGDGPLNVATRKSIQDSEKDRKSYLAKIKKATGVEFELEVDWVVFAGLAKERGYDDRIGECINWYLDPLSSNLESLCKDDMSKEAVVEAATKKVITFAVVDDSVLSENGAYSQTTFSSDGAIVISLSKDRFCSNVSEVGRDIESRL